MPAGLLYEAPPHTVNIYSAAAPTTDSGGGVKLNWPSSPSWSAVPCIIHTQGSGRVMRQGQESITVTNRVSFWTAKLTELGVVMTQGVKLVAPDTGRTFIVRSLEYPNRPFGDYATDMPALTYCMCDEIL